MGISAHDTIIVVDRALDTHLRCFGAIINTLRFAQLPEDSIISWTCPDDSSCYSKSKMGGSSGALG